MTKRPEWFFTRAHAWSFSPASLKKFLAKAGFGTIRFNAKAGVPGGMETLATPADSQDGQRDNPVEIPAAAFLRGERWEDVVSYVQKRKRDFDTMRRLKRALLFWLPTDMRNLIAKRIHALIMVR